jgi:hypothetical protein
MVTSCLIDVFTLLFSSRSIMMCCMNTYLVIIKLNPYYSCAKIFRNWSASSGVDAPNDKKAQPQTVRNFPDDLTLLETQQIGNWNWPIMESTCVWNSPPVKVDKTPPASETNSHPAA